MATFKTEELAREFGVTPSRVRAIARTRKITAAETLEGGGHRIALWSEEQREQLRPGRRGRPSKQPRKDA